MSLETQVMSFMKDAMKNKDEALLRGLRAIKAEIIKAKTEPGANGEISEDGEMKLLQKLVKQRKDSLAIYEQQSRPDLAAKESEEIAIIEKFLPAQMSEEDVKAAVQAIVTELGAAGPQDLGKVMGVATKKLAGQADGKVISAMAKAILTPQ
ncbi:MAG: GatB/YqeY domain-containing protein [Chitinophagaceae bacterium]|nr:MAG: GatB/YqeY domain-containing protein [Chitinophagaceae bacterium]